MKAQNEWQRQMDELKARLDESDRAEWIAEIQTLSGRIVLLETGLMQEVARLKESQRYFAQLLVIAYMNDDTVSTSPEMQRHLAYLHGQSGND